MSRMRLLLGGELEDEPALDEELDRVAVHGLEVVAADHAVAPQVADRGADVIDGDDRIVDFGGKAVQDYAVRARADGKGKV